MCADLAEGRGQRLGRFLPHLAVGVLQPVQRRLQKHLLAADIEAQLRHRLVEQPVPGAAPGDRLLVEELLDAVFQLIGLVLPEVDHPRPIVAEDRIGLERLLDQRVVDQVELKREEQEMRAGVRHLLLDVAVEFRALRVGRVAGIDQPRIGGDAADQFLQRLEVAQCDAELACRALLRPRRPACLSSGSRRPAIRGRRARCRPSARGASMLA